MPGTGILLASVETACTAVAPAREHIAKPYAHKAMVLGKPNPGFARYIAEEQGLDLSRTCMVGDRLVTDILMGQEAGMKSLLVLTGVDCEENIEKTGVRPSYILPSVAEII